MYSKSIYKLPSHGEIRISSRSRFVLVRWPNHNGAKPFVVRHSDFRSDLENSYQWDTDCIVDRATGQVSYHRDNRQEVING